MTFIGQDSTGQTIRAGDRVRWYGHVYMVRGFTPGVRFWEAQLLHFEEPVPGGAVARETEVDRVEPGGDIGGTSA
jgi:hypothetical protein